MWQELERLVRAYQALELERVLDYEKFCTISIVWHSTKIEGCSLTEMDTRVLLENDLTAAGKPLSDHLMVKDHYNAFEWLKKQAQAKARISLPFLQALGAQVMKHTGAETHTALGSFDTSKGDWRLVQVYVEQKYFPDFRKVPALLQQFCNAVGERVDAVTTSADILRLAADVHYNFVNIHPFADGNGRSSRLLMNYIQLYHGQPIIKIFTEDRTEYLQALNAAEEAEDLDIFREFVCRQQIKFLQAEIEKYRRIGGGFKLMM